MASPVSTLKHFKSEHPHHADSRIRSGHISPETDDIIIYTLLVIAALIILGGALWLFYDAFFRQHEAEQDLEHTPLIPHGYADPEGYGAVGIHISSTSLIRKAWTLDGKEVDYLSD